MQFIHKYTYREYVEKAHETPAKTGDATYDKSDWDNYDWRGGTLEECNRLALEGWSEGVERIEGMLEDLTASASSRMERVDWIPDVEPAGNLDVARYLENEPECWLNPETSIIATQGRLIHITFNATYSGGLDQEAIFAHGAKTLALIQALEISGNSVQLDICHVFANNVNRDRTTHISASIVRVKEFGEPLDLSMCAFLMCHRASLRYLGFRNALHFPISERRLFNMYPHGGFGGVGVLPKEYQGDINIEGANLHYQEEIENMQTWVDEQLAKCGVSVKWNRK